MASIDDIQARVTAQKTVVDSAVTLLQEISAELKAALASNDPAAVQAVIDSLDANTKELADAVQANTPASPPSGEPTT